MRSDGVVCQQLVGCMHDVGFWLCRGRNLVGSGDVRQTTATMMTANRKVVAVAPVAPVQPAHVGYKKSPAGPERAGQDVTSQNASTAWPRQAAGR